MACPTWWMAPETLLLLSVISTFITKSLLTFFGNCIYWQWGNSCFRFSSRTSSRYWRGAAHFLYLRANRREPLCSAIISALNDLLLVALASNTSISFCLSIPYCYCPTNFIPEGLEKTIVRKFSHPACRSTSAPWEFCITPEKTAKLYHLPTWPDRHSAALRSFHEKGCRIILQYRTTSSINGRTLLNNS